MIRLATLALGLANGCAVEPESTPNGASDWATSTEIESGLSSTNEKCDTFAADARLTGGGYMRTPDTYDHHRGGGVDCWSAYLLDLKDYDAAHIHGANLGYAGPKPTTEANCTATKLRAHIWRVNSSTSTTYLDGFVKSGRWVTNFWGEKECITPVVNIEKEVAGFQAGDGRDYRIAFRAETPGLATTTAVFHTPDARLPNAQEWSSKLDQLVSTASQFNANSNLMYSKRNTEMMKRACRNARLDLIAKEINAPSLVKAGAQSATVQAHRNAYQASYNAICANGAPPATMTAEENAEKQLDEIYRTQSLLRDQIASTLGITKPEALTVMAQSLIVDLQRVMSGCNANQGQILDYLHSGALPSGASADRLLLGTCQGTPTNAGSQFGIGADLRGVSRDAARRNFAQCMDALEDAAHTEIGCGGPNGPISQGGDDSGGGTEPKRETTCTQDGGKLVCDESVEVCTTSESGTRTCQLSLTTTTTECKPGPSPRTCTQTSTHSGATCHTTGNLTECDETRIESGTPREVEDVVGRFADAAFNAGMFGLFMADTFVPSFILLSEHTDELETISLSMVGTGGALGALGAAFPPSAPIAIPAGVVIAGGGTGVGIVGSVLSVYNTIMPSALRDSINGWAKQYVEDKREQFCRTAPRAPMCGQKLCPAHDINGTPAFYTKPSGLDEVTPLGFEDRIDHCLCALTDNAYNGSNFAASSKMCPTREEREKQDCLTNPFDEVDRPKPQCVQYLYPTNIDMNAWYARLCERVRPNCDNDYITPDGTCGCGTTPFSAGELAAQCPNRNVTDCGPDATLDMKTCSCQGFGTGDLVWGGERGCSLLPETFPGGTDFWQSTERVWSDAVKFNNQTRTVLRILPGPTSVVAPPLFLNDFERDIGNDLKLTMLAPSALLSSDFPGETNVHVTIPELNLFNEPVGQVVHRNLTANQLSTASLPLSARHRTLLRTARDVGLEVRFSVFANTSARSSQALALAGIEPGGALRAGFQRKQCRATPDLTPPLLGPTFLLPGVTTLPTDWSRVLLERLRTSID